MSNQPRIPDPETRERHIAKLKEICQRWDVLIAGLDELNAKLDADFENSPLGLLYKRRAERLANQKQASSSQL
ncbi:hypothetical protein [Aerosakkonema funiforme]|uniref:Uncharacterized protein n=1 Tax=Aerosakkonema funiforme FACHB-1375 TaxID=2949571 RepID=A0A926VEI3_9CYAN|nr:hypothetical protein [Aerosakkonema funiforme]MBD2181019.1 hypothetical protein [Aerosakkonema funiforme FACHB-1375]